jgi:damage-control phosphatase, subfamily I
MKTCFECIPCFGKQIVEVAGMLEGDEASQNEAVLKMMAAFSEFKLEDSPPVFAQRLARIARPYLQGRDPFHSVKKRFNNLAMHILPGLQESVKDSPDPFGLAVRLCIVGNIIDSGVVTFKLEEDVVTEAIMNASEEELFGDINPFKNRFLGAEKVLWLADNAGEIVLDQLLLSFVDPGKVTIAVRGKPILNDATMTDAREIGLTSLYRVIENGSDAPGTILADCSPEFMEAFNESDLIVSKGQGNYETLSSIPDERIFYLLKAKCAIIARDIGCDLGKLVIQHH